MLEAGKKFLVLHKAQYKAVSEKSNIKNLQKQLYELNENIIKYNDTEKYRPTDLGRTVIKTMMLNESSFKT